MVFSRLARDRRKGGEKKRSRRPDPLGPCREGGKIGGGPTMYCKNGATGGRKRRETAVNDRELWQRGKERKFKRRCSPGSYSMKFARRAQKREGKGNRARLRASANSRSVILEKERKRKKKGGEVEDRSGCGGRLKSTGREKGEQARLVFSPWNRKKGEKKKGTKLRLTWVRAFVVSRGKKEEKTGASWVICKDAPNNGKEKKKKGPPADPN